MTTLHSSGELYQAERVQYNFIASNYRNEYGVSINYLPIFMMGKHVERTRTVSSYRANYRMGKRALEHLVNELLAHEEFFATALFRLGNCHIGYRQAYNNFTTRTLKAIEDQLDPIRANAIAVGFGSSTEDRLNGVIGAVDGKNFIIHQPSPPIVGAMFRDRKNNYSVKLTAVCNSALRFTYIKVGDSGIVLK
ncbi:uncharacterized protein EV154DRAFT_530313 [Mucor mucedo]|uniref:uncharacterized protein n=1 Tax=Mucor mucedo TaxID=29922 RepID=UPI0022209BE6|nr:uncharacterized protein EV154DRAFT_530313 [Mucor mucedo]KAI7870074.1 hypothetical protein EV154DRAFT_530313 [Mucor mucedo]